VIVDPDRPSGPDRADLFSGGGEAGRIMAAFDWAGTSVGPVETWPASLRYIVRTVLVSRFPMIVLWGPDLLQFYNDAYAPVLGAKHPAIGRDIRRTQPETWDALGPPIAHAMTTLEASWMPGLLLPLDRYGFREETYFTVSHAPAFGDDGEVEGIHAVCTEVTAEIVAARRQRLLHELASTGALLEDEQDLVARMCHTLAGDPLDVPVAAVYLAAEGQAFERVATVGCAPGALPPRVASVEEAAAVASGLAGLGLRGGQWDDPVTGAVALPLAAASGAAPLGVVVMGFSPNLAADAEYRSFFELLAGQFAGAVVNARAYEAERHRAESLAALDRAKTTFFSDVSHELRTPLTLLLGPVRDVLDDPEQPLGDDAREQLRLALRNGQRLQRLVNDLLDVASIEAGRTHPVRVRTDVATFTAELAGIFRAAVERAGLELSVDCPPLDRPAHVDPRMWEKVVVNLLSNAVKYTFIGSIDVRLRSVDDGFTLTVADTGVGIPAEELPRLFQRFHRVSGSAARTREGTGIGLALVHELVALHGGSVTVASEPGVGSRFTVTMPSGVPDDTDAQAAHPSDAAHGEAAGWELTGSRPAGTSAAPAGEVLVVDDNPDMRAYLTRILSPTWNVRTTADGEEALEAATERLPDVVVTDVMMPRMDGFDLLRALRREAGTRAVPVIMLTARAGQDASVEGLEAGADDYLAKPFQAAELLARVRAVADRARVAAGPAAASPPAAGAAGGPASGDPAPVAASLAPVAVEPLTTAGPIGPQPRRDGVLWRLPSTPSSVPQLRRRLRALLDEAGVDPDQAYDLLLAACEAATNAVEHAQDPIEPYVDVRATVTGELVEVSVRDYGQWRERMASLDRGRGSTLMTAVGEVTATPGPEGTTVVIRSPRAGGDGAHDARA
jgi:signal transduction histidine kinase/ActR/RegA family two-component response regulator